MKYSDAPEVETIIRLCLTLLRGVSENPIPGGDANLHHPAFLDKNWQRLHGVGLRFRFVPKF